MAAVSIVVVSIAVIAAVLLVPAKWAGRIVPGSSIVDDGAVAFEPGAADIAADLLKVSGLEIFRPTGKILFTTVSIDDSITIAEWVQASLRDSIELHPRDSVFGDRTSDEQRDHNLQLMAASKNAAVLVALKHLGIEVMQATGLEFDSTVEGTPADGLLDPDWVIVALDGNPVTSLASLQKLLAGRGPGTTVTVTAEIPDTVSQSREVTVTLGKHPDNEGGFLGIRGVRERLQYRDLPFEVAIESGSFGGPSAGLAFTLAILDVLTPGELTGGLTVAVTGTIALDGSVGPVGGIAQKMVAAERADADLFIVPSGSNAKATKGADDMDVIEVSSLTQALAALVAKGGEAIVRPGPFTP